MISLRTSSPHKDFRTWASRLSLVACLALLENQVAHGAIVDCRSPSSSGYAVFLDEPQATPAAFKDRAELLRFMDKLQFTLDQGRDGQWVQLPNSEVRFARCEKRTPALDGADFADAALIETLYNQTVLLEIWGSLDAERTGGKRMNASAQMSYLLVPFRYAADQHEATLSGILQLVYPEQGASPTGDFIDLLARPQDLDAFISAALGYKALRERRFDLAHSNLCQSSLLLKRMQTRLSGSRQKAETASLTALVVDSAGRAVREAKKDSHYTGTLRLQDAARPCPEAVLSGAQP